MLTDGRFVQCAGQTQEIGAGFAVENGLASAKLFTHKHLVAPGRNAHFAQIGQGGYIIPHSTDRFTAAIGQQTECVSHLFVAGEDQFVEHLRGNTDGFLRIHKAPHFLYTRRTGGGQFLRKAKASLAEQLKSCSGVEAVVLSQIGKEAQIVFRQTIHHGSEALRIIHHGNVHIFHAHQVHNLLRKHNRRAAHDHLTGRISPNASCASSR